MTIRCRCVRIVAMAGQGAPLSLALGEGQGLSARGSKSMGSSAASAAAAQVAPEDAIIDTTLASGVEQRPAHRKCGTCTRYDAEWDTVDMAGGVTKYLWWALVGEARFAHHRRNGRAILRLLCQGVLREVPSCRQLHNVEVREGLGEV